MLAFELDPVRAAPGQVGATGALSDEPLHVHFARTVEKSIALFIEVRGKP